MRTKGNFKLVYILFAVLALSLAACGNSKKKSAQTQQTTQQPQDSVTVIETETVVIAVDSIAPDSTKAKKAMSAAPAKAAEKTPKKTK